MYRVLKMSGKVYAFDFGDSVNDEAEDIQEFLDSGDVVLLGDDLEDIAEIIGINAEEIEIVD